MVLHEGGVDAACVEGINIAGDGCVMPINGTGDECAVPININEAGAP